MKSTDYLYKCYVAMTEYSNLALKETYYMEFTAGIKLLTESELGELRRKIFKYKEWF